MDGRDKTEEEVAANLIEPDYYNQKGTITPIEFIMSNKMSFPQGSVIKYITRYRLKADPVGDLRKARQYIDYLIEEVLASQRVTQCKEDKEWDRR